MTITYPIDLLAGFPGWTTEFDLLYRQEQSRQTNGKTFVKTMGAPLWAMSATSRSLSINELDYWRARLKALGNGQKTFLGYSKSRCYPILYPNGSWPTGDAFSGTTAALASVGSDGVSISVSALPSGYKLSIGDYVAIGTDLHQVMEAATAGGGGTTTQFEVRPPIWPGVTTGAISVRKPSCIMAIVPGSISSTADAALGRGVVSFQAVEARS